MRFIYYSTVNVGIIGDYDVKKNSHTATNNAIEHAAKYLDTDVNVSWLPTQSFLKKRGNHAWSLAMLSWLHRVVPTGAWKAPSQQSGWPVR